MLKPEDLLTPRELQVLTLVADGLLNHEIASRLHLTVPMVKKALTLTYDKIGAENRVQAARWFYRRFPNSL